METGIIFERSAARPFAVSLANGLPEHIRRDDVKALREEKESLIRKAAQIEGEITIRLAQAQAAGFDTKGW